MKRRLKPERRKRVKVEPRVPRSRFYPARKFLVTPDPSRPFVVLVLLARDRRRMREAISWHEGSAFADSVERECMGLVRHYYASRQNWRPVIRPGGVVARIFLNARDLQDRPSEIVSHECGHAAMAWARLQRADLRRMAGEEVMCYALGRLVAQVNRICFAHGVWAR